MIMLSPISVQFHDGRQEAFRYTKGLRVVENIQTPFLKIFNPGPGVGVMPLAKTAICIVTVAATSSLSFS